MQTTIQATLPFGPYDPAGSIILKMSMAGEDAVQTHGQAPKGAFQHRPLGLGSKSMPSSADNYLPSGKQLLACSWALAESKHLTR